MVNVEKVKHQCQIVFYELKEEKRNRGIGQYYRSDFIGKEVIKSIFTGTIAYAVMAMLWIMANIEAVLDSVNDLSIVWTVCAMLIIYVGFLVTYLVLTYIVYAVRYKNGKTKMDQYKDHLRVLNQMYEREEKLKL